MSSCNCHRSSVHHQQHHGSQDDAHLPHLPEPRLFSTDGVTLVTETYLRRVGISRDITADREPWEFAPSRTKVVIVPQDAGSVPSDVCWALYESGGNQVNAAKVHENSALHVKKGDIIKIW